MTGVLERPAVALSVRLADSAAEVAAAQSLRFRVFYDEMGAQPSPEMAQQRLDFDEFDAACDHLLVIDSSCGGEVVVATYRLHRPDRASFTRFYTAGEYDLAAISGFPGNVLELGRSCVDAAYRTKATMQLLWQGVARYVFTHGIDLMFGCASLPGTDIDALAAPLSYLHHNHLAPAHFRPRALSHLHVPMDRLPVEAVPDNAMSTLPPLLKGYLRLGGFIGDGAVVDHQFNTTDVCVIVKTDEVADRYGRHYGRTARVPA